MTADTELIQKRQEVQEEILALKEQIPSARILNTLGKAFKQNSVGYWLSNIVFLNLIILSPWVVIGLILRLEKTIPMAAENITGVEFPIFGLVWVHIVSQIMLNDSANRIVGQISTVDDLINLSYWFKKIFSIKSVLTFALSYCLIRTIAGVIILSNTIDRFVGIGYTLTTVFVGFLSGVVFYFAIPAVFLFVKLKDYHYAMNVFSPADSQIISEISESATKLLYIGASSFALITLIATSNLYNEQSISLPLVVFVWIFILVFFLVVRSTLGTITDRAKWKTLNRIRDKMNALEATGDLSDKDTAERLLRLADIHKQVMASNTKIFDWKSVTTLFSQLMLPLLGLLLGNLDRLLELLTK